jgi:predicted nucleic acid-binding protein
VAVKWTAIEQYWQQARCLLETDDQQLIAPVTLLTETLNALVKKFRNHEISADTIRDALESLPDSLSLHPLAPLSGPALELSLKYGITVHDGVFLALALRERCQLVTNDRRFINAVQQHFPETFVPLASLPTL